MPAIGEYDILGMNVLPRGANATLKQILEIYANAPVAVGPGLRGRQYVGTGDCCPCAPGQDPGDPRQGQAPAGLNQPSQPQKPFQSQPQDPCSYVDEVLKGLGLSKDLLMQCGCGKCNGGARAKSSTPAKAMQRSASSTRKKVASLERFAKATRRKTAAQASGRYVWQRKPGTKGGFCRDKTTNKIVKWANCGH